MRKTKKPGPFRGDRSEDVSWAAWLAKNGFASLFGLDGSSPPPFADVSWSPIEVDRAAAWKLHVELQTRVATQALRYDEGGTAAPEVVATGVGEVAQHILDVAQAQGVPIREDADLVELLAACDLGDEIPLELYEAVAEVLTWLYRLNASLGE